MLGLLKLCFPGRMRCAKQCLIAIAVFAPLLVSSSLLNDNCEDVSQGSHRVINIGAMFPFAGSWPGGVSCFPAAQLALSHVNCHQSRAIVDGFKLNLIVTNTSVSITYAIDSA